MKMIKERNQELMSLLGLKDNLDGLAREVEYDGMGIF